MSQEDGSGRRHHLWCWDGDAVPRSTRDRQDHDGQRPGQQAAEEGASQPYLSLPFLCHSSFLLLLLYLPLLALPLLPLAVFVPFELYPFNFSFPLHFCLHYSFLACPDLTPFLPPSFSSSPQVLLINFPSLGSMSAGENFKFIFREAKINDAILFFDECEAIFESREKGSHQVNLLLTEIER